MDYCVQNCAQLPTLSAHYGIIQLLFTSFIPCSFPMKFKAAYVGLPCSLPYRHRPDPDLLGFSKVAASDHNGTIAAIMLVLHNYTYSNHVGPPSDF